MFCSQDIPKLERASRPVVQVLESPQPVITFFSRRPARRTLWSLRCPWRTSPGQLCRAGPSSCLSSRSGGGQRCEGMRDFSCSGRWGSRASRSRPAAGRGARSGRAHPCFCLSVVFRSLSSSSSACSSHLLARGQAEADARVSPYQERPPSIVLLRRC